MNKNSKNENNVKKNTKEDKQSKGKEVKDSTKRNEKSEVQKDTKSKDQTTSTTIKRPSNSYMFFSRDKNRREEIASKYNLKGKELVSKMGEIWKNMTEAEKKPY